MRPSPRPRVGNVKNNDPSLIEPIFGVMNLRRRLAAVFVILAVASCAQVATGPGNASYAPYSSDDNDKGADRGIDGGGGRGSDM